MNDWKRNGVPKTLRKSIVASGKNRPVLPSKKLTLTTVIGIALAIPNVIARLRTEKNLDMYLFFRAENATNKAKVAMVQNNDDGLEKAVSEIVDILS